MGFGLGARGTLLSMGSIYEIPRRIEANALSALHNRGYHARELRNLYHGHPEN